jgi:selenocysteine lyase/cysteine desulfurase
MRAAMATLPLPGHPPASVVPDLFRALLDRHLEPVVVPFAGRAWIRISAQIYTTLEDFDALGEAVTEIL